MTWHLYKLISDQAAKEKPEQVSRPCTALLSELNLLNKQKCAYCSGFGHSADVCPTDAKLAHLRTGVAAQAKLVQEVRKAARKNAGMTGVKGFSRLKPIPKYAGTKRTAY